MTAAMPNVVGKYRIVDRLASSDVGARSGIFSVGILLAGMVMARRLASLLVPAELARLP